MAAIITIFAFSAAVIAAAIAATPPYLLQTKSEEGGPLFAMPRGVVLLVAALTCVAFLVEGAMLDWSALLLVGERLVTQARGGLGYMLYTIAMTCGRFSGDRVVARLGERRVLVIGSLLSASGLLVLSVSRALPVSLLGFVMVGLGSGNIVPILFRRAGNERKMPAGLALAAVTTAGYAGLLAGPPFIGFIARVTSLPVGFLVLAVLLTPVAIGSRKALTQTVELKQ